jgi:hypothetical protein
MNFGHDPLGLTPAAQSQSLHAKNPALMRGVIAYRAANLVVRGFSLADHTNPTPIPDAIGDDGAVLTFEERQKIAGSRRPYDAKCVVCATVDGPDEQTVYLNRWGQPIPVDQIVDYRGDLTDRKVEKLGASTMAAFDAQPEYTFVPTRVLV